MTENNLLNDPEFIANIQKAPHAESFGGTSTVVVLGATTDPIINAQKIKANQTVKLGLFYSLPDDQLNNAICKVLPLGTITPKSKLAARALSANFTDGQKLSNANDLFVNTGSSLTLMDDKLPQHLTVAENSHVALAKDVTLNNCFVTEQSDLKLAAGSKIEQADLRQITTGINKLNHQGQHIFTPGAVKLVITNAQVDPEMLLKNNKLQNANLGNNQFDHVEINNATIMDSKLTSMQIKPMNEQADLKTSAARDTVSLTQIKGENLAFGFNYPEKGQEQRKIMARDTTIKQAKIVTKENNLDITDSYLENMTVLGTSKTSDVYNHNSVIENSDLEGIVTGENISAYDATIQADDHESLLVPAILDTDTSTLNAHGVLAANKVDEAGHKFFVINEGDFPKVQTPKNRAAYQELNKFNHEQNTLPSSETINALADTLESSAKLPNKQTANDITDLEL